MANSGLESTRKLCLSMALEYCKLHPTEDVIETAEKFEKYITG